MYGIPDNIEWSFLVGRELLQICVSLHQVSLRFDGEILINIECDFAHRPEKTSLPAASKLPQKATSLVSLVGTRIADVTRQNGKTLAIAFSNNETLEIYDSNESYESFQVVAAGKQVIV